MPLSLDVLDTLPTAVDFYAQYWNKRPFLASGAIEDAVMAGLITPDELAGLSMEETARARMVSQGDWTCRSGPFAEEVSGQGWYYTRRRPTPQHRMAVAFRGSEKPLWRVASFPA